MARRPKPNHIRRARSRHHAEFVRPWLYPLQEQAVFSPKDARGQPARISAIEASTKSGKTTSCLVWLLEQAMQGLPNYNYWWTAPVYGQAEIAFRRMKAGLPAEVYRATETPLKITLANGATIWFKSAEKPDNLYGEDVYAAVMDEASRMREEAWHAVRSTLTATRGPVRMIGNVKGRRNFFYLLCRRAEGGEPGLAYYKITAYDAVRAGVLDADEIEAAKRDLPEHVFRELYLAEASDDGGNPFGFTHIAGCVAPLSEARPFVCGVDLAKSVDWTVVIALDKAARTCGFERWQASWETTTPKILDLCGRTPTLVDSTGVGDPIVERLQAKNRINYVGYHFSSASKQRLMEGLSLAIQQRAVAFPDGQIRRELDQFEYVHARGGVRYSAPEGYHDDCVMALALAVEKWRIHSPSLVAGTPHGAARVSPWTGSAIGNPSE